MGTGPHVPDGHRSIGPRVGGGPGWAVGYTMTVPRGSPGWGSSGPHTQAAGPGPEARAHHGLNPGGAQDARVGRAERVVAQHPPAVAFGADGPLHRKLSRAGGPADEHHLSWPRRGAEANQHDVAVVQGG